MNITTTETAKIKEIKNDCNQNHVTTFEYLPVDEDSDSENNNGTSKKQDPVELSEDEHTEIVSIINAHINDNIYDANNDISVFKKMENDIANITDLKVLNEKTEALQVLKRQRSNMMACYLNRLITKVSIQKGWKLGTRPFIQQQ